MQMEYMCPPWSECSCNNNSEELDNVEELVFKLEKYLKHDEFYNDEHGSNNKR